MDYEQITTFVTWLGIAGFAALWITWDLIVVTRLSVKEYPNGRPTISRYLLNIGRAYPIIVLLIGLILGILFGHWWWPLFVTQ